MSNIYPFFLQLFKTFDDIKGTTLRLFTYYNKFLNSIHYKRYIQFMYVEKHEQINIDSFHIGKLL